MEDSISRIQRQYREQCIKNGTYRQSTEEDYRRAGEKWKELCRLERIRPVKKRRSKKPPKGTAD